MAKKPPVTVEVDVESADGESTQKASTTEAGASRQEKGSQPADAATNFKAQGAHARRLAAKTRSTAASWVEGLAPGHSNAVIFGVLEWWWLCLSFGSVSSRRFLWHLWPPPG